MSTFEKQSFSVEQKSLKIVSGLAIYLNSIHNNSDYLEVINNQKDRTYTKNISHLKGNFEIS
jgi:hypothetical protein